MKKLILIMLTLSTLSVCGQTNSNCESVPLSDWTVIQTNISIRQEQNTSSRRLAVLKQFEEVNVLSKGKKDVIDGKEDYWYKVGYKKGGSGWVFGYFTSLKMEGQKTIVLEFEDYSLGDLEHITFGNYDKDPDNYMDFGGVINNLKDYQLDVEDSEGYTVGNPKYKGKKFKITYNNVMAKTYCNAPENYDVCIEPAASIIMLELIE